MNNDQLIAQHVKDKKISVDFKERRLNQWNENYFLYRDKIATNRLSMRQPVNIPIMRETIQTWISKIDEPPFLTFEARTKGNKAEDGQIIINQLWDYYYDKLKLDLVDNLQKKVVGLQGRVFKKWGWANGEIFCDVIDPYDIEIDPRCSPLDISTASFVIHKNIFKPLREILSNEKYDNEAKNTLKVWLDSKEGIIKANEIRDEWFMRQERLRALGAYNFDDMEATDLLVEINESYRMVWSNKDKRFVRHLIVIAADKAVLYNKPLKEAIGIERLPIVSWADDPDLNDIWCDGKGDNVRTINKIVNIYFSQDLENRAHRNYGMYFYNTLNGTFSPRAFEPKPFGMYGVPGNPDEIMKQMRIEPLSDTSNQISFLKDLVQSSVAQTATERGIESTSGTTLGEVKLNLQQSTGRNEVTAKNYRKDWEESGEIFYMLLEANSNGVITLYKKSAEGNYESKDIFPSDWVNPKGYECKVVMKSQKDNENNFIIQKLSYIDSSFVNNPVALKLSRKKKLEVLGWTPEEIEQVMQYEEQASQPQQPIQPEQPLTPQQ